jgi:hypothetical protein
MKDLRVMADYVPPTDGRKKASGRTAVRYQTSEPRYLAVGLCA